MSKNVNRTKREYMGNSGSTLITVIVAIAFVTILTMIILSTSVMNYKMKAVDRQTKDEFYYAEKALNDIYTGIGQDTQMIAANRYNEFFTKAGISDADPLKDYTQSETAEKNFKANFLKDVVALYDPTDLAALTTKLNGYIVTKGDVDSIENVVYEKRDGTAGSSTINAEGVIDADRINIKGVQISVTEKGYTSVISTDIIVECPSTDFLGSNIDVTDYGVIACKGLYIGGNAQITGNVYGGTHSTAFGSEKNDYEQGDLLGGININSGEVEIDGNYIVSKGDINLSGTNPQLTIATTAGVTGASNLSNVWFNSLRITEGATTPKVHVKANLFALNDLEINADSAEVKLEGNYYGYNNKALPAQGAKLSGSNVNSLEASAAGSMRDDSDSSAIIINGNEATVDLKDLDSLVIMGRAYIDLASGNGSVAAGDYPVVSTAEGLALKTNQQAYLVPIDFLSGPNPVVESGTAPSFDLLTGIEYDKWFGFKYTKDSGTPGEIQKNVYKVTIKVSDGVGGYTNQTVYYAFLSFNDSVWMRQDGSGNYDASQPYTPAPAGKTLGDAHVVSSMTAFFDDIVSATGELPDETQPSAYRMRNKLENSLTYSDYYDLQKCVIDNTSTGTILYSQNAVLSFDDVNKKIVKNVNTAGMERFAGYPNNLFDRYRWLCTKLDAKDNIPIANSSHELDFTSGNNAPSAEWDLDSVNYSPMNHFVTIPTGSIDTGSSTIMAEAEAATLYREAFGDCIVKYGDLVINAGTIGNTFKGIAIVNGDITVANGINVDGLLMATGRIVLAGNNVINSDKGLIQARIEKEVSLIQKSDESVSNAYKNYYLISYLIKDGGGRLYSITPGTKKKDERIEADYNDYMHYENWQKGPKS